jgi:hypothetical protein
MAPEQLESPGDVDQRADIYSLGVVLYELLTGELPLGRFAPPSKKSAVDARIDEIVMRTLERERELRFQTVGEVKTQVAAATEARAGSGMRSPGHSGDETVVMPTGKTARRANAALVCTSLSLGVGVFLLNPILTVSGVFGHEHMRDGRDLSLLGVFVLTVLAATTVPGTMLAMRALREIRSTGGKVAGFKRAMTAALAWPSILVVFMSCLGISIVFQESGVSTAWRLLVSSLLLAAGGLGVLMVRQTFRWMKDAHPAIPLSGHVWRSSAAALLAFVCLGAYVRQREASMKAYLEPSGTKMTMELNLPAGKTMSFRIVRVNARGEASPLELGGTISAPDDRHLHTTLEIVSTSRWKESDRQKLEASYNIINGQTNSRSVFLDEDWKFNTSGKGSSPLMEGEKQRDELATRYDWLGRKVETLYVEIVPANNEP